MPETSLDRCLAHWAAVLHVSPEQLRAQLLREGPADADRKGHRSWQHSVIYRDWPGWRWRGGIQALWMALHGRPSPQWLAAWRSEEQQTLAAARQEALSFLALAVTLDEGAVLEQGKTYLVFQCPDGGPKVRLRVEVEEPGVREVFVRLVQEWKSTTVG